MHNYPQNAAWFEKKILCVNLRDRINKQKTHLFKGGLTIFYTIGLISFDTLLPLPALLFFLHLAKQLPQGWVHSEAAHLLL